MKILFKEFTKSINDKTPPKNISKHLLSLWYAKKGDWNKSHNIAQDIHDDLGAWIHAFLHRQEGDLSNADYWYSKARKNTSSKSLDSEIDYIITYIFKDI